MSATARSLEYLIPRTLRCPKSHGEHIYLYRNIKTNEVIYSLNLNPDEKKVLKQLVFVGKKCVPAEYRPDVWRPYAAVKFPKGYGWLGLLAYRKLREYRMLRYYSWDKTKAPIAYKKRQRMLRDHRQTSVADLSQVIFESQKIVEDKRREWEEEDEKTRLQREARWADVEALANLGEQGIQEIEVKLRDFEQRLQASPEKEGLKRQILALKQKRNRISRAMDAVKAANGEHVDEKARRKWTDELTDLVEWEMGPKEAPPEDVTAIVQKAADTAVESVKKDESAVTNETEPAAKPKNDGLPPDAIKIRWIDLRDAEWAQDWHPNVYHEPIGILKTYKQHIFPEWNQPTRREVKIRQPEVEPEVDLVEELENTAAVEEFKPEPEPKSVWSRAKSMLPFRGRSKDESSSY